MTLGFHSSSTDSATISSLSSSMSTSTITDSLINKDARYLRFSQLILHSIASYLDVQSFFNHQRTCHHIFNILKKENLKNVAHSPLPELYDSISFIKFFKKTMEESAELVPGSDHLVPVALTNVNAKPSLLLLRSMEGELLGFQKEDKTFHMVGREQDLNIPKLQNDLDYLCSSQKAILLRDTTQDALDPFIFYWSTKEPLKKATLPDSLEDRIKHRYLSLLDNRKQMLSLDEDTFVTVSQDANQTSINLWKMTIPSYKRYYNYLSQSEILLPDIQDSTKVKLTKVDRHLLMQQMNDSNEVVGAYIITCSDDKLILHANLLKKTEIEPTTYEAIIEDTVKNILRDPDIKANSTSLFGCYPGLNYAWALGRLDLISNKGIPKFKITRQASLGFKLNQIMPAKHIQANQELVTIQFTSEPIRLNTNSISTYCIQIFRARNLAHIDTLLHRTKNLFLNNHVIMTEPVGSSDNLRLECLDTRTKYMFRRGLDRSRVFSCQLDISGDPLKIVVHYRRYVPSGYLERQEESIQILNSDKTSKKA